VRRRGLAPRRRDASLGRAKRGEERALRERVVGLAKTARAAGLGVRWLAQRLGMAARTLWAWLAARAEGLLAALGRPGRLSVETDRELRRAVLELLWAHPHLGARRIARLVPELSRRVVADWKDRVEGRRTRSAALRAKCCVWNRLGRVWAMDHTDLPAPTENGERQALVVRDLASGKVLSSKSVPLGTAREVVCELERLFMLWGAPLVLKCDNGAPLVAGEVRELLDAWGVVVLRSPPRRPAYNGSAERGLGWWKLFALGCAEEAGRENVLSAVDLEEARRLANELPRERRPAASESWAAREAISCEERQQFLAAWRAAYEAERTRLEVRPEEESPGSRLDATIGRRAARAALCELNYLTLRRR
jgi:hypothetical protein